MTTSPRPRRLRVGAAGAAVAVLATLGLTACGESKPAQSAVQAKLKTISEFKSLNDATLGCIAGVLEKYGSASSLNTFVKSGNPDDIKGKQSDESNVTNETKTCVTSNESGAGSSTSPSSSPSTSGSATPAPTASSS